jgi:hypothetical protein
LQKAPFFLHLHRRILSDKSDIFAVTAATAGIRALDFSRREKRFQVLGS